jgi:hypothetical protein
MFIPKGIRLLIGFLTVGFMMFGILIPGAAWAAPSSQGDQLRTVISQMTLEEKVGQMFMVDFPAVDGKNVDGDQPDIEKVIKKYPPRRGYPL